MVKFSKKFRFLSKFSKISKNVDFGHNFPKIFILVKIFENFRVWSNFFKKFRFCSKFSKIAKNVDFSKIFVKFRFCSKFTKNGDFFENCEKFRFWSNVEKFRFWSWFSKKIEKRTILDKIGENFWNNVDFSQVFKDIWFWSKFTTTDFFWKIRKKSILFKFLKIFDFCQNLRIWRFFFWKIPKNFDLSEIFEKNWILVKFSRKTWIWVKFFEKISILFPKISISVEINEKFWFFSKISKNVDLGQIFEKNFDFG